MLMTTQDQFVDYVSDLATLDGVGFLVADDRQYVGTHRAGEVISEID